MNRRFSDVMIPFTRVLGVMDLRRAVFESGSPRRQLSFVTVWPRRRPIAQDRDLRLKLSLFTEVPDCDTSTFIFPSAIEISIRSSDRQRPICPSPNALNENGRANV